MIRIDQAQLYQSQISLSEWFEKSGNKNTTAHRLEDNEKRKRLRILNEVIKIPFDKPVQFEAIDIANKSSIFKKFLNTSGDELCALRLIPKDLDLPKLRIRGMTVKDSISWFKEQSIDPQRYKADFIPHGNNQLWSTIFIVNQKGMFGEIIKGGHYQLTQGFYDSGEPIVFSSDFKKLILSKPNKKLKQYLKGIFKRIKVDDSKDRKLLEKKLDSTFASNYLCGYFETVDTEEFGLWFVDYNRILDKAFEGYGPDPITSLRSFQDDQVILRGFTGSPGKVMGKVKIVNNLESIILEENEILVCQMTTPDHLPLMQQACAIITDFGGILSHAAIICRELGKPCITSTKIATKVLKDGDLIEVNADRGTIHQL